MTALEKKSVGSPKEHDSYSAALPSFARLFIPLITVIFVVEFLVMFILSWLFSAPVDVVEFLTDSSLLSVLCAPLLWLLIGRPLRRTAMSEMKRSETVMQHVVEGVVSFDSRGTIESFNPAAEQVFGYSASELIGKNVKILIPEMVTGTDILRSGRETSSHIVRDLVGRRKDGAPYHMDLSVSTLNFGDRTLYIGMMRDVSERRRSEKELSLAAKIFENIGEATVVTDTDNNIISVNPAFTGITGYTPEEVIGQNPRIMSSGRQDKEFYREMWESILAKGHWQGEMWDRRKNGEIYPKWLSISTIKNKKGEITNHIGIFSDITARKEAEQRIQFMAHYDALTGLPNRVLLRDRLFQDISHASRNNTQVAILFLDLDRFKTINDSLGHSVGDQLLQSVAERLKDCLRTGDTVARLGGDEFVVILPDIGEADYAALVANKILSCVTEQHTIGGVELNTTVSIGISVYPHDGKDIDTLIKNADVAMYKSKEAGRNSYMFFTEDMNARAVERLSVENSLRRAIEREEFVLHFQPQVRTETGRIIGAEALIRWNHPDKGLVMPGSFIPIAEESGLIVPIGEWVLYAACMKNREWQEAGLPAIPVAVNLSAQQFRQKNLVDITEAALKHAGLGPKYLELEITESSIIHDAEAAIDILKALKVMGLLLSIDDFGTGYSNLGYLKRFPIDKLKIDQSFVRGITYDPDDAAIVSAIISLGQSLKLKVIAEGVETKEHFDFLKANDCDEIQGYYFSRPLPDEEFRRLLGAGQGRLKPVAV